MAARTPRRTFAHPFVVTLAAVPACVASTAPAPAPTPAPVPSPTPSPAPAPDSTQHWYVTKSDGACTARVKFDCPQPAQGKAVSSCNPPRARPYPCPAGQIADEATITVVRYANSEVCVVEVPPVSCPPNISCNPPAPARVACPE